MTRASTQATNADSTGPRNYTSFETGPLPLPKSWNSFPSATTSHAPSATTSLASEPTRQTEWTILDRTTLATFSFFPHITIQSSHPNVTCISKLDKNSTIRPCSRFWSSLWFSWFFGFCYSLRSLSFFYFSLVVNKYGVDIILYIGRKWNKKRLVFFT